jgi:hypothetical protein
MIEFLASRIWRFCKVAVFADWATSFAGRMQDRKAGRLLTQGFVA